MNRAVLLRCAMLLVLIPGGLAAQEAGALAVTRGADTVALEQVSRQTTRVIVKDDSVAVDEANRSSGVKTLIFPTMPFFNLGGGQTVTGMVRRVGADSAAVRIGTVEFRCHVDRDGRILGGAVPSQGLSITRGAGR